MTDAPSEMMCPLCATVYPAGQTFCHRDGAALQPMGDRGDLVGRVIAEKYRVLKRLGEGGMGQVYLAEHVVIGRRSALKVMHPDMTGDPQAISRFTREATNASRIEHPHVAAIYDYGSTREGLVYITMEFVDGRPLSEVLRDEGPLSPTRTASLILQTADGLQAVHAQGIVHRDLKPDNIMVSGPRNGPDLAKVVDFGVSKVNAERSQDVTSSGIIVGTPIYMSPEQVSGVEVDGASDQFTLAIIAFELMTGALPYEAANQNEQVAARVTRAPRTLAAAAPGVAWSPALEAVIARALDREPTRRFRTIAEFGRALERAAIDGSAVRSEARTVVIPPTVSERAVHAPAPETSRRRTGAWVGAAVGVVVVAAGLVFARGSAAGGPLPLAGKDGKIDSSKPRSEQGQLPGGPGPGLTRGGTPTEKGKEGAPVLGRGATRGGRGDTAAAGTGGTLLGNADTDHPGRAAGGTTPASGGGGTTPAVTPPSYDATADLARLKQLSSDENATPDLQRAVSHAQAALKRITVRRDSVMALYYTARAYASLGETDDACGALTLAARLATGSDLASSMRATAQQLECK